jgi:hypothetical protein
VAIDGPNLAEELLFIKPAKAVFGSVATLLTTSGCTHLQDTMANGPIRNAVAEILVGRNVPMSVEVGKFRVRLEQGDRHR